MIKIIDGKKYDTNTAKKIHYWNNGIYNDFRECEETLYKTKKSTYFLYGEGGAMSKYAQFAGSNSMQGGLKITPITGQEAFEWLCTHEGEKAAELEFSNFIEEA